MKQAGSDSFFERMERRRKNRLRPQSTTVSDATADLLDLEEAILPRTHHQERQQREPFDPPRGVVPPLPIIVGSSFAHTAAVSSSAGAMLPPPPPRGSMSNTMQWLNGPVKWTMTDDWHEFDPTQAFSCLSAERTQPAMATMPRSSPPEVGVETSGSRAKPEKSKDQTSCHEGMGTTFAAPAEKGQDGGKTSTNPTATAACEPTSTTTTAGGSPEPLRSIPFNAALEETQGKDDGNPEDASRRSPQPNRQEEKGEVGGATSCHHHLLGEETARKRPRSEEGDASSVPSLPEDRPATHNLNRCPFLWNITTTALEPSSSALPSGGLVATPEGGNPFSPGAMRVSGPQFLNSNSSSNIFAFVPGELLLFHRSPNQPRPSNNSELWKEVPRTSMSPSSHRKRDSAGIHSDDDAAASADDEGLWRTLYWDDYTMRKGGGAMMMSPVKELAECVGQLVARRRAGMAVPATEQQSSSSSSSSLESSSVPPPPSEDQEGACKESQPSYYLEPAIPQGWTIQRNPNASVFTMTKSFSGESLELKFGLPAPKTGGAAAGGSEANNVESMTLTITKGSEALRFTLSVEEQELILENVAHYTDAAVAKDDTIGGEKKRAKLYNGPVISELDATFVDSFVGYLEERGVNDELAVFVTEYIFWVEQQEYENWLSAIAKFTS